MKSSLPWSHIERPPFDPAQRGYVPLYVRGGTNYCPGCARSQWWIGRSSAECAWCSLTLPFANTWRGIEVAI